MDDHAERAAASASEAHADGRTIFVWTFGSSLLTKGELSPLADQIEAIEAVAGASSGSRPRCRPRS
jgi:hypothetical protein